MIVTAPNFVSVRLDEDDKRTFAKVAEAAQKNTGVELTTAQIYRLAMRALAEQLDVKTR
jgi:hypothetical protein